MLNHSLSKLVKVLMNRAFRLYMIYQNTHPCEKHTFNCILSNCVHCTIMPTCGHTGWYFLPTCALYI